MRIYIIGNDGITLCREPAATVNNGEVAVASREELHTPPGSAANACWRCGNALPGVEKPTKVGDRDTPDRSAVVGDRGLAGPGPNRPTQSAPSKQEAVIAMLQRPEGATVDEVASVMGWQRHNGPGALSPEL